MKNQITLKDGTNQTQNLLSVFLSGRNKCTLEAYRTDLEDFNHFVDGKDLESTVTAFIALSPGDANGLVLRYRNTLVERGFRPNTINRRLAALRSLVKLARIIGLVAWSLEIPNLKAETYRDTRGPGRAAIQNMLAQLESRTTPKQVRDNAILRLLYDLALRASEVINIDVSDVDLSNGLVAIIGKGKTDKTWLTIPTATVEAVSAWMDIRDQKEVPLFYNFDRSSSRQRLTRNGLYQVIRKLGIKVGVQTRPHGIRHTSITQAIKAAQVNGATLPDVKQFSRHASLQTLQIYADRERDLAGQIATWVSQSAMKKDK